MLSYRHFRVPQRVSEKRTKLRRASLQPEPFSGTAIEAPAMLPAAVRAEVVQTIETLFREIVRAQLRQSVNVEVSNEQD
jgi:hypothetical protein